ncbi:MAG: esterase [Halobacteriovoraceae bacterium]|jgi:phospholipase/carboxylesterase|nr:esterase [Halobacteriovoraceae bacterium]
MLKNKLAMMINNMPRFIKELWHKNNGGSMQQNIFQEKNSGLKYLKKSSGQADTAIILFHGYGASMHDLFDLSSIINTPTKCDWYFPNGHLDINLGMGMQGKAWFPVDMQALELAMRTGQHRDFQNMYTQEFQLALEKTSTFLNQLKKDYRKIIVGGFSQGAMLSSHISLENSSFVDALICFSGVLVGKKEMIKKLEASKKFPFYQCHGKQDPVLSYSGAKELFELFKLGGHDGEFVSFDGGHEIPPVAINGVNNFLARI